MATNLYLCFPDAQITASAITAPTAATVSTTDDFSFSNTLSGNRQRHYRSDANATSSNYDYDLGSGNDISPDYFIISRADILSNSDSADPTITLRGSASGSYTSPEDEVLTLTTASLSGYYNEDVILETTFSTSYRYWRLIIATTESFQREFSKLYFGNWLNLGRDPIYPTRIEKEWVGGNVRKMRRVINLRYRDIADDKRIAFEQNIARNRDIHPIFLYDKGNKILKGGKLVHCSLLSHAWSFNAYGTDLDVTFEELI